MKFLGDFFSSSVVDFKFNTQTSAGSPITLAGTPLVRVYKANGTTEDDSGITLTTDFDSVVGCHHVRIDTSSDLAFYTTGSEFQVVLTQGTVDGTSIAGSVLALFSIENRPVNVGKVSGEATELYRRNLTITGSPTTTSIQCATGSLPTASGSFVNMFLVLTSGTYQGIGRQITAYSESTGTATFTVDAFPGAPSAGNTFALIGKVE
jgi:hypothetical protein